ncbi:MAG: polyphenol oxidase family protein [Bacteriovoracaceae bacterium]
MKLVEDKKFKCGNFLVFNDRPEFESFYEVKQVHGNKIVSTKEISNSEGLLEADGIIHTFDSSKVSYLSIKTADCLPILLEGINGVAMIHAGWRGLHNQILFNPELKKIDIQRAYIGPHIKLLNYEVSQDFTENFPNSDAFTFKADKVYFDLEKVAVNQIKELDSSITVEISQLCTHNQANLHSYRQNKTDKRNWNLFQFS